MYFPTFTVVRLLQ